MTNKCPLVSVIIANYNKAQFLSEALNSALSQTYQNFEIIIVDDTSTDGSIRIIKNYAEKHLNKIKPIFFEKRLGAAKARNCAIEKSNGKYIAILDSDDKWESDNLNKKIHFLETNKKYALVGSWGWRITESGKIFEEWNGPCNSEIIKKEIEIKNFINHSSVVFKKRCFFDIGMYKPEELGVEDWKMLQRFSKKYEIANLSQRLCSARVCLDSMTLNIDRDWKYRLLESSSEKKYFKAERLFEWTCRFYTAHAYIESFQALLKALRIKWFGARLWAFLLTKFLFRPTVLKSALKDYYSNA